MLREKEQYHILIDISFHGTDVPDVTELRPNRFEGLTFFAFTVPLAQGNMHVVTSRRWGRVLVNFTTHPRKVQV